MNFNKGDRVMFAQREFDFVNESSHFGLTGTVETTNSRGDSSLCEVTFDGAGKHIVECCSLELLGETNGATKRIQEQT